MATRDTQETGQIQQGGLSTWLRRRFSGFIERLATGFVRLGISPNGLTITGALLSLGAALLAAQGSYLNAGILYVLAGPFDAVDGAVARVGGRMTRFGAILDSTLDRYSESLLLTGIGYSLARSGEWPGLLLTFLTVIGSLMVSYTRARSEGLSIDNKGGLLTRFERAVVLSLALLTGLIVPGLLLLAVLTQITVVQRLWHVYQATRDEPLPRH